MTRSLLERALREKNAQLLALAEERDRTIEKLVRAEDEHDRTRDAVIERDDDARRLRDALEETLAARTAAAIAGRDRDQRIDLLASRVEELETALAVARDEIQRQHGSLSDDATAISHFTEAIESRDARIASLSDDAAREAGALEAATVESLG